MTGFKKSHHPESITYQVKLTGDFYAPEIGKRLEAERSKKTGKRITYNCLHAKYPRVGTRVLCDLGRALNPGAKDGGIEVVSVLAGRSGAGCRLCPNFVPMEAT